MNGNDNNLNSDISNQSSKIINLQNEIDYLNSQIINKINAINAVESNTGVKNELIKMLKEIIISQREEITLKNEHFKQLELNFSNLATKVSLANGSNIYEVDGENIIEDRDDKIGELNITIEELLKKNAETQEIIDKLREESNPEFWEDKISDLNKTIIDLADENAFLRDNLEKAHEKSISEDINKEITELRRVIKEKEEENNKLEEKNRMLKAALLMTVDTETKNISDSPELLSQDSEIKMSSKNNKKVFVPEGPSVVRSSEENIDSSERKRQCPKCGASGAFILEIDDKSTIIYQDMGSKIYGKKYKCGDCRYEWK